MFDSRSIPPSRPDMRERKRRRDQTPGRIPLGPLLLILLMFNAPRLRALLYPSRSLPGTASVSFFLANTRRYVMIEERAHDAKTGGKPWHTRPKSVVRARVV